MDSEMFSDLLEDNLFAADVDAIPGHATNEAPVLVALNAGVPSNQAGAVIAKIENIFESITDSILNNKNQLVIPLKARPRSRTQRDEASTKTSARNIAFPNKNPKEAWKFTVLLRILELSHEALVTGIVTTKRDIYYRDPELFVKQQVVDRYVDDIAYTFGVDRQALNVTAAAKGLVAGAFNLTRSDGTIIDFAIESEGVLVPNSNGVESIQLTDIRWILVIEKEATFRTLATSKYWKFSLAGPGIIITAKGYPDIQTRRFLHLLSTAGTRIPILALVDYDPDGLGIVSTYKHGSMNFAHEKDLIVPSLEWLGVRSSDFLRESGGELAGLLTLTKRDRRVAEKMLARQIEGVGELLEDVDCRRELQVMLLLNVKTEIQILGSGEKLGHWLDGKLLEAVGKRGS